MYMNTLFERYLCEDVRDDVLYVADYYSTPGARQLAHMVKLGDAGAIKHMATQMAALIDFDAYLIPIPSRTGVPTTTKTLANIISDITGYPVVDILRSNAHESLYTLKYQDKGLSVEDFGMHLISELPTHGTPVLIDNMMDTGATIDAALSVVPSAIALVHSLHN